MSSQETDGMWSLVIESGTGVRDSVVSSKKSVVPGDGSAAVELETKVIRRFHI